ncbi:amino acid transporter-like protein [Polyplosphaeria fusca]|uniref:Amino acid transporter-like protein n=1 Tax=Polyplosphaeria fusca TaxID=682080 RepID=A0A9P4RC70_9PLEO|nr:amino acid transporter-like protein [Polyplosphaeria fusca]
MSKKEGMAFGVTATSPKWNKTKYRGPTSTQELSRRDESHLSRLGKKQVLKRRFGMVSMLGMSTTLMLTWEGILVYFGSGLSNGGSAGLFCSYFISWVGFLAVMTSLAELASIAPTSSGQYHWVYMLSPVSIRKLLSYLTGWLSIAVWQAMVAMSGCLCATLIQGLLVLNHPESYDSKGWHGTLLIWSAVLLAFTVNSVLGRWLPKIEGFILYLHLLGFFAIVVPMLHLAKRVTAKEVFTQWNNDGGWNSMGLSFLVGMITTIGPFVGADGAVHMAEETHNAAIVVPWNIIITVMINGCLGLGMLLTTLFCMGDLESAMKTATGYPFIQIFFDSTHSYSGTTLMVCIPLILSYAACFGQFATASRQLWAFARDRGPPFSNRLLLVNPNSFLPMNAVIVTCSISLLLSLINIGSHQALNNILSFTVSSWEAASSIPLALLLWNRATGRIKTVSYSIDDDRPDKTLVWGPWRVPEPLGTCINAFALTWIVVAFFFSFWPGDRSVEPESMNYSSLMTGFWFVFGVGYYAVHGRKYYKGPVVET